MFMRVFGDARRSGTMDHLDVYPSFVSGGSARGARFRR
ncbi:MAG: hypothetical protein OJF61_002313 [Rhodanobacteraceae bacterium]|nr:MAG: hypothetical protein OJF61_002313 [Rhodanobacteraceae bacterium]